MKHFVVEISTLCNGYPHSTECVAASRKITNVYAFTSKRTANTYIKGVCHSAINVAKFAINSPVKYVNNLSDIYTEVIIARNCSTGNNGFNFIQYYTYNQDAYEDWLDLMMDDIDNERDDDIFDGLDDYEQDALANNIIDVFCGYSPKLGEIYDKDLHDMYYLAL